MAAPRKLSKFLRKLVRISHVGLPSMSKSASLTSTSEEPSSVGSSRRSWTTIGDASYDSDLECSFPPADVPEGCLAVYVGAERRRFVIPTEYLNNSVFRALLAKSEEEFGYHCDGGLRIACTPDVFEHMLWWLEGATTKFEEEAELVG